MDESLDEVLGENYGKLSLKVSQSPLAFGHWEELINYLLEKAGPLNKALSGQLIQLIRQTYKSMLTYLPYLENYSIDYALFEYKLGNIKEMHEAFTAALQKHNNYSLLIWIEYLKACNEVVIDNKKLFRKYELAESFIGLHFYSGEFWEMYLEQVRMRCSTPNRYILILRKVIELPIYSYSRFYAMWLSAIDDVKDVKQLATMVPEQDLKKKAKIDVRASGRKGPQLQETKKLLKRYTKEMYMVVQHRVLEFYNLFEINLRTQYYTSAETLINYNEITTWLRYLDYSINNGINQLTQINFQRALIPLAHYEMIWLKYASWLVQHQDFVSAKTVLLQGLRISHKKAKIIERLSTIMLKIGHYSELIQLYNEIQNVYGEKIEELDDYELFFDYFLFTAFLEKSINDNFKAGCVRSHIDPLKLALKRLSYGENKRGQVELLHAVCQMYSRFSHETLENKIFRPIINQDWSFYLNNGMFWFEYCHSVWFDPSSSYLEKRRNIVNNIIPLAVKQEPKATKGVVKFCEMYLPEDLKLCNKT
ncbi:mRNA splicing protein PRP42 [Lachancea thermotolerans CBS 6340]|uniref:KLTH0E10626p n=1 Tax=Lachancea thermotolerans (strain ATCC 56472 / CBS 6340 / NRRL Y-8284) TaxID=559295 RepID=C5DI90_LACTC|nr:KLTH0E10626p [Lachancea thermotolerans CBS 6340]CAR23501.1 KLTH0E10626p [Lachancea thermotolerans CBS 6340]